MKNKPKKYGAIARIHQSATYQAVLSLAAALKIRTENLWVIHDHLDVYFGQRALWPCDERGWT